MRRSQDVDREMGGIVVGIRILDFLLGRCQTDRRSIRTICRIFNKQALSRVNQGQPV